jgi:hypothetical protein
VPSVLSARPGVFCRGAISSQGGVEEVLMNGAPRTVTVVGSGPTGLLPPVTRPLPASRQRVAYGVGDQLRRRQFRDVDQSDQSENGF